MILLRLYCFISITPFCCFPYLVTIVYYDIRNLSIRFSKIILKIVKIFYVIRIDCILAICYSIVEVITMPIKMKLKVMLAMREMTQKELSEKTGVRPPTISAICTGSAKHIPVDVLERICEALDCQPGDIVEYVRGE